MWRNLRVLPLFVYTFWQIVWTFKSKLYWVHFIRIKYQVKSHLTEKKIKRLVAWNYSINVNKFRIKCNKIIVNKNDVTFFKTNSGMVPHISRGHYELLLCELFHWVFVEQRSSYIVIRIWRKISSIYLWYERL